jgi:hypothetical protein
MSSRDDIFQRHDKNLGDDSPSDGLPSFLASDPQSVPELPINFGSSGSSDELGSSVLEAPHAGNHDPLLDALAGGELGQDSMLELPAYVPSDVQPATEIQVPFISTGSDKAESKPVQSDSQEVVYVTGPSWPMLLLGSYASAVTLALIWLVVIPRFRGNHEFDNLGSPTATPVGTRVTNHGQKVEPAAKIPADRKIKLGQSIKLGSLEFTALDLARQDIKLSRKNLLGGLEEKEGGTGALTLHVRIHNHSSDLIFAPVVADFVRDKDSGMPDSFVELGPGERVYLYPLPIESEWQIVGQEFPELKPGESRETRIVTVADFPRSGSDMTWHLKLRTGLDSEEVVGVTIPAIK